MLESTFSFTHNVSGTNPIVITYQGVLGVRLQSLIKDNNYYHNSFSYFYMSLENHKKIKHMLEEKGYECFYYSGSSKEFICIDDKRNIIKLNLIEDSKTYFKFSYNLLKLNDTAECQLVELISELAMVMDINTKINYFYFDQKEGLCSTTHQQKYTPDLSQESYPNIPNIDAYFDNYFNSNKAVLIFIGEPGTGKTSLIRNISARYTDSSSQSDGIFYTASAQALNSDALFQKFIGSNSRLMVLEDIDMHLSSRQDGNEFMYKLLSTSDGFIKSPIEDKKIIISTNLSNIRDIDEALIRKGRCYGVVSFRKLDYNESVNLLTILGHKTDWLEEGKKYTLAELYNPD